MNAADLIASVGLSVDGLARLGRPVAAHGPGVYLVELPAPIDAPTIEVTRLGKWIERVPSLRLDGARPTSRALRARLLDFWLPRQTILFVGSSDRSIAGRVLALERHVLGDARPHAASQWLKALSVDDLRVRWALTDAPEEYEDALLEAFAADVGEDERARLPDTSVVLPFANQRTPSGQRKSTGLVGSTLPVEQAPEPPPTRIVELPPGDADGAAAEPKGTGRTRRTNDAAPTRRPSARPGARHPTPSTPAAGGAAGAPRPASQAAPTRPGSEPMTLTAEGRDRLQAELDELTGRRRREVVARIRAARELGDLKENADYHAAREEQSFLEGRVQSLEATLRSAIVVESAAGGSRVVLGSRVTVEQDGDRQVLSIVSPSESDPRSGRISDASPVGRALVGRSVGEEAVVGTPGGEVRYTVVEIE